MGRRKRDSYSLALHPEARQRALWLIRDYPNIKERIEVMDGYSGASMDGGPRSTVPHSAVQDLVIRRAELSVQIDMVDKALAMVPEEYRKGIWDNIMQRKRFPDCANINTWKKWKQLFVYMVARDAGYI